MGRRTVAATANCVNHSMSRLENRSDRTSCFTASCVSPTKSVASRTRVRRRFRPGSRVSSGRARKSAEPNDHDGRPASLGSSSPSAPDARHNSMAALGCRTCSIVFSSSCFTRSFDNRSKCGALSTIADQVAGSMRNPNRPANRRARNARSRSSTIRSPATPTARTTPCVRSSRPRNGSCSAPLFGEKAIALIVKSRRARSSSSEAPNSTTACRPSVRTSWRKVVTSCMRPCRSSTPMVPNCSPTGIVRLKRRFTSVGVAAVARSQSRCGRPSNASRTAPPTHQVSKPARSSVAAISRTSFGGSRTGCCCGRARSTMSGTTALIVEDGPQRVSGKTSA